MSWITGLADKAENILNKIDKNAATALQQTALEESALRRNLSNSTQSLKATLSPMKIRNVKSEKNMSESVDSKENLDWKVMPEMSSSRRSSVNSKPESVTIDMSASIESEPSIEQRVNTPNSARTTATALVESTSTAALSDNQELLAFKIALNEITNERDELRLQVMNLNRDIENAGLRQHAQELEMLVQRLTEERDQAQHELHESNTASSAYVHSISELETSIAKLQQEYLEVAQKLQMQMKATEQQRQELHEYRTKAQLALQMKDNVIAELKVNGNNSSSSSNETDTHLMQIEFDALKQEHKNALEEINNLRLQLEEVRHDWGNLNKQHTEQLAVARTTEEELRKELRLERERSLNTESEQRVTSQELMKLRQQLSNQMAASATRLQEKEQQLQQLRAEQMRKKAKGENSEDVDDYSMRLKTLTQALVDKQNKVEGITAERNALRIQLEKVQDQLKQVIYNNSVNNKSSRNVLLSNSTDDAKAQFPSLMRESPFDNRVARRVKRAYTSLDSAGVRLGAFLRRYPLMRIFVLMYVGLLHVWVVFVLLWSTPN